MAEMEDIMGIRPVAPCHQEEIQVISVETEEELKKFVVFSRKIYEHNSFWPGQVDEEELRLHDPKYNLALDYLKTELFLAFRDGEVVGRISVMINDAHNKRWDEKVGFFGHFECIDDQKIANKLLETAENWCKEHGLKAIHGPFSYTYYDVIGILVDGFVSHPTIGLPFHLPYYSNLLYTAGYTKLRDLYETVASVDDFYNITQKRLLDIRDLVESNRFSIRMLDEKKIETDFLNVLELYNEAFRNHWAAYDIQPMEWLDLMEHYYSTTPKELCLIVEDEEEPIAFLFLSNDDNQKAWKERQGLEGKIDRVKAFIIGMSAKYQSMSIGKWLLIEIAERLNKMNYKEVSFSWIDEENTKSVKLATGMGGEITKRFRVFTKSL